MFTGIITAVGAVAEVQDHGGERRIAVDSGELDCGDVVVGDSIAVDGVCLTVVARNDRRLAFDVSAETLARTILGTAGPGARVNLEKALLPTTRLSGHLVSGHIDGVGTVAERRSEGQSVRFAFDVPQGLDKYIAYKGSLCVNGVSLTVNDIAGRRAGVNIIPHTLGHTNLGALEVGMHVNLEVDLIARYLERLVMNMRPGAV